MFRLSRYALGNTKRNFALCQRYIQNEKQLAPTNKPTTALIVVVGAVVFNRILRSFSSDNRQSTSATDSILKDASNDNSKEKGSKNRIEMENKNEKITVNKDELKKRLTPLQYQVTQEAGTERPFTGCYNKHYEKGVYQCIVCHQDLFSSDTKYDSGCGWPAFNDVLDKGKVTLHRDASIPGGNILLLIKHPERIRTEVRCARCNAHMGHVFEDGPMPTRKRYCINSASINFVTSEELNKNGAIAKSTPLTTTTPIAQQ